MWSCGLAGERIGSTRWQGASGGRRYIQSMRYLTAVEICVPTPAAQLADAMLDLLAPFGTRRQQTIALTPSRPDYLPVVTLRFATTAPPRARFLLDDRSMDIALVNTTGDERCSPYRYQAIPPAALRDRLRGVRVTALDHVGFDLPWFAGIHPALATLREVLAPRCAYFLFPTGEPWNFILPATRDEITLGGEPDLHTSRRPKVEIVFLDTALTPFVQVDFVVDQPFEGLVARFPEGLAAPGLRNVWVYLAGSPALDLCCVFNAQRAADWSPFFAGHRLQARNT
jgi:hypothetical protein